MAQERLGDAIESSPDSRPRIHGAHSSRSIRNLRLGHVLALEMVRSRPTCRALFAPLAGSGVESISTTHYAATTDRDRARVCAGGVAAFTTVGGRVTWPVDDGRGPGEDVVVLDRDGHGDPLAAAGCDERFLHGRENRAQGELPHPTATGIADLVAVSKFAAPARHRVLTSPALTWINELCSKAMYSCFREKNQ